MVVPSGETRAAMLVPCRTDSGCPPREAGSPLAAVAVPSTPRPDSAAAPAAPARNSRLFTVAM